MSVIFNIAFSILKIGVLSNVPFYAFWLIMYKILKKLSPNGNIAERFFCAVSSDKENKIINTVDFVMNYIIKNVFIVLPIFLISVISVKLHGDNTIYEYIASAAALRMQKYMIESLLTIILAVFGLIVVFSSLNKQYYLFFSSKDIIETLNIKEHIISIIFYCLICVSSVSLYYINFYIVHIENKEKFYALLFPISIGSAIVIIIYLIKMFHSIIKFLFSKTTEYRLLNSLYYDIHKKSYNNITIQNEQEIYDGVDHLLLEFSKNISLQKEQLKFIPFVDSYDTFSIKTKNKLFTRTLFIAMTFSVITIYLSYNKLNTNIIILLFGIVLSFVLNFIFCKLIYCKKHLKKVFIHLHMWSWGFEINNGENYASTTVNKITNNKYDNYLKSLYNILCFYRKILCVNQNYSLKTLKYIVNKYDDNFDYVLLTLCHYLYFNKYGISKQMFIKFKKHLKKFDIDYNLLNQNLNAIATDIFRDDVDAKISEFLNEIQNSNKVKIKEKH